MLRAKWGKPSPNLIWCTISNIWLMHLRDQNNSMKQIALDQTPDKWEVPSKRSETRGKNKHFAFADTLYWEAAKTKPRLSQLCPKNKNFSTLSNKREGALGCKEIDCKNSAIAQIWKQITRVQAARTRKNTISAMRTITCNKCDTYKCDSTGVKHAYKFRASRSHK